MLKTIFTRRGHAYLVLAVAVALVAAFSVPPASAAGTHSASGTGAYCTAGSELFSSLGGLTTAGAATRGDEAREPASSETAIEVPRSGKSGPNFRATIPVYFHVVHDGPLANLTQKQIDDQMSVLNLTFGGFEGGYNTGFKFKLAGVTRTDNGDWLRHGYGDKAERDMKRALHTGGRNALNIYSTEASGYLGWAYFPTL